MHRPTQHQTHIASKGSLLVPSLTKASTTRLESSINYSLLRVHSVVRTTIRTLGLVRKSAVSHGTS